MNVTKKIIKLEKWHHKLNEKIIAYEQKWRDEDAKES